MPTMTIRANDLRAAINNTLPILKRTMHYPSIDQARLIVEGGGLHLVSTDRWVALANPVHVVDMEDKRRVNIGLTGQQLKMLKAWLTHIPHLMVTVRINNEAVTLEEKADHNTLRLTGCPLEAPDVLRLIRREWDMATAGEASEAAKVWNPTLVSHMPNVKLYSSGGTMKAGLFTADGGAFGIIMPVRWEVADTVQRVRQENGDLFDAPALEPVADKEGK